MSDLYNRIDSLCASRGISITKMCVESGANRASLTDLKMGRKKTLSSKTLLQISSYFDVSIEYLLGKEQKESPPSDKDELSEKQRELIAVVSELPDDVVSFLLAAAKEWLSSHKSAGSAE